MHDAVETFTHTDGSTSYVVVDSCALPPAKCGDTFATLRPVDRRFIVPDGGERDVLGAMASALDYYAHDYDRVGRYLRMFFDVVAFDWQDVGGATYLAAVSRMQNRAAMGDDATDDDACHLLASELEDYRAWVEGETYGVIVEDADGNEADSCFGMRGYPSLEAMVAEVNTAPIGEPEVDEDAALERYRDMLDEVYGPASIAGYEYDTSRALETLDPIAFRTGFVDWLDSES